MTWRHGEKGPMKTREPQAYSPGRLFFLSFWSLWSERSRVGHGKHHHRRAYGDIRSPTNFISHDVLRAFSHAMCHTTLTERVAWQQMETREVSPSPKALQMLAKTTKKKIDNKPRE